jgi:hypothetical protein
MAAISNNKYDVFNWIKSVCESCQDNYQIRAAERLVVLFFKRFDDYKLRRELDTAITNRVWAIVDKKLKNE